MMIVNCFGINSSVCSLYRYAFLDPFKKQSVVVNNRHMPSVVVKTLFRSRDQDRDLGHQVSRPRPRLRPGQNELECTRVSRPWSRDHNTAHAYLQPRFTRLSADQESNKEQNGVNGPQERNFKFL